MKKVLIIIISASTVVNAFAKHPKPFKLNEILIDTQELAHNQTQQDVPEIKEQSPEEWITIFVHGTVGNSLCLRHFFTLFKKCVTGTPYEKETLVCRNGHQWCKNQAAQGLGLQKIDFDAPTRTSAHLFAYLYNRMQKEAYPSRTTRDYYTFGWSGLLNHDERCNAAALFYQDLKTYIAPLKQQNPNLKIQVVAHSHGANMVLHTADVHNNDKDPLTFNINELIVVAAPIQRETDCKSLDPFFENTYSVYSRADCVQKMDCFSLIRFFSGRKFKDSCRCEIGNVVQQIELKITVAADQDLKACSRSKKRINRSPGHIEFWHFAQLCFCEHDNQFEPCWTSRIYRSYFPLEPLPAAVFVPTIVAAAQKHLPYQHAVVELQPDTGKLVLRKKYTSEKQIVPFMHPEEIRKMRAQAMPYLQKELTES